MRTSPMFDDDDLPAAVAQHYEELTAAQRRAIDLLLGDIRYGAVVSTEQLAEDAGVSRSVLTRAAQALGYSGFPELQSGLRRQVLRTLPQRLESVIADLGATPERAAVAAMGEDVDNLKQTLERVSPETLREGVELLVGSHRIFVFGVRGSYGLAQILVYGLRLAHGAVYVLGTTIGDVADQMALLTETDVLITVSLRRTDRVSVQAARTAARLGVPVVAITDHPSSALARMARATFIVPSGSLRLLPSYAAAASLMNGIVTAVAVRRKRESESRYQVAEQLREEFQEFDD